MSSGPSPTVTYNSFVELNATDASASNFRVGNINSNQYTFTIGDGGNNDGILGDMPNESATITTNPSGFFLSSPSLSYWGKTADNSVILRQPSSKTPDGYTYALFSNGTTYRAFDNVPSSNFSQSAFALCFVAGTRILTTQGAVAVEDLRVGDLAVTAAGLERPITWTGHRHLGVASPLAVDQAPVRIRVGAFGPGLPARDLRLSPGHPVLLGADLDGAGGVLVPVMCLINGTTIAREPAACVTYWHVELDAHDILLAEGLPAESYIDLGSRPWFGGADGALFDPDFVAPGMRGRCRPVAVDGPLVEAERRRIDAAFAQALADDCAWSDGHRVDTVAVAP